MRLLLFGGSFDPVHFGHLQLLENAVQAAKPDKVVVMPVGIAPHKQMATAQAQHRIKMCACFREVFAQTEISDRELRQKGKSYTFDTVQFLQSKYPDATIYLSIGGDSLLQFHTWHCYERILPDVVLLVQQREEQLHELQQAAQQLEKRGARILFCKGNTMRISSTQVRNAVAQRKKEAKSYVPPLVWELIEKEGLYLQVKN